MKIVRAQSAHATFFVALAVLANPALAASCVTPLDANALKTAALQQELMVAALQCHEETAYNEFVMTYREELQTSDAALKSFFLRRDADHGERAYDSFKTKAANLSALDEVHNTQSFCADTHNLFAAALSHRSTLANFVESRSSTADLSSICRESASKIVATAPKPPSTAMPAQKQSVKVANAQSEGNDEDLGGVPTYEFPASPYKATEPTQSSSTAQSSSSQTAAIGPANSNGQDNLPPPPPRDSQVQQQPNPPTSYSYGNYNSYQNWQNYARPAPQPWNWYPPGAYYSPW